MPGIRDSLFGRLAVEAGFVTREQIEEAIAMQRSMEEKGLFVPKLGEILAQRGYMSVNQVMAVLSGQHTYQEGLFGSIAVSWKFATEEDVNAALEQQKQLDDSGAPHQRIGEILISVGKLRSHQVEAILDAQRKRIMTCPKCSKKFNVAGFSPGDEIECTECGTRMIVGQEPEAAVAAAEGAEKPAAEEGEAVAAGVVAPFLGEPESVAAAGKTVYFKREEAPEKDRGVEIGGYKVISKLGADATGTLVKARHLESGRTVALKLMAPQAMRNFDFAGRFLEEGRKGAELHHRNIKALVEVGHDKGRYYFATEFVEGVSCYKLLEQGHDFTPGQVLEIGIQVAEAVGYAHGHGVVHGDVRPSNIILASDGTVKVAGLGLAKDISANLKRFARASHVNAYYIAPEQAVDDTKTDVRSDIYALGATLYHLVTGQPPYEGSSPLEVLMRVSEEELSPPDQINREISPGFSRIIVKMMQGEPADRYPSMSDVVIAMRLTRAHAPRGPSRKRAPTVVKKRLPVKKRARAMSPRGLASLDAGSTEGGDAATSLAAFERRRGKKKAGVGFWIGVVVLVLVCGGGIFAWWKFGKTTSFKDVERAAKKQRRELPTFPAEEEELAPAGSEEETAFNAAVEFLRGHRDQPEKAIRRFEDFRRAYPRGALARRAETHIRQLGEQQAQVELETCSAEAGRLRREGKFAEALNGLLDWQNAYAVDFPELNSQVQTIVQSVRERQRQEFEALLKKARAAQRSGNPQEAIALITDARLTFERSLVAELDAEIAAVREGRTTVQTTAIKPPVPQEEAAVVEPVPPTRVSSAELQLLGAAQAVREDLLNFDFVSAAGSFRVETTKLLGTEAEQRTRELLISLETQQRGFEEIARLVDAAGRSTVIQALGGDMTVVSASVDDVTVQGTGVGGAGTGSIPLKWKRISPKALSLLFNKSLQNASQEACVTAALIFTRLGFPLYARPWLKRAESLGADPEIHLKLLPLFEAKAAPAPTPVPTPTPAPVSAPLPGTAVAPVPAAEEKVAKGDAEPADLRRALQAIGWAFESGEWTVSPGGVLTGKPGALVPAMIYRLTPRKFTITAELHGSASLAGFYFGANKEFMVVITDKPQTIVLSVERAVSFTVDGQRSDGDGLRTAARTTGQLGAKLYLRAVGGTAHFKVTIEEE